MAFTIALAGNPNSGKSTLFNALTGSNQYVGNWPGVTVEKKSGKYKKDKDIKITDLPGIYSLSPYTLEEVVSRDYLLSGDPDVIVNIVDASNIERNLYLSTQLSEIGLPMLLVLNMMDVVKKNGDNIDTAQLAKNLNCEVVEISALKGDNIHAVIEKAAALATNKNARAPLHSFSDKIEGYIGKIQGGVSSLRNNMSARWYAIKLFENDPKVQDHLQVTDAEKAMIQDVIKEAEAAYEDDGEGIITDERYTFVSNVVRNSVKKGRVGLTISDKVDKIVTNRFLALPIFVVAMFAVYWIAITVVGGPVTDWVNDTLIGEYVQGGLSSAMEGWGAAPWLTSLVCDGIIGGVGAPLGFLPQIITLFFLLAILEDIGYMARIAFILDRVFRRFGLSGKSFIPILIGTGCAVPGIMATRTIENDKDRRMTIMVAAFLPCSAKVNIIALFAGSLFEGYWWFAPLCYFAGILAVIVSGIMLKKFKRFSGEATPFVMELPEYHIPSPKNVLRSTWDRTKGFILKAATIIFLVALGLWLLENISVQGHFHEFDRDSVDSILSFIGKSLAWIFIPVGFGDWISTVATIAGLAAKEVVVSTMGVLHGVGEVEGSDPSALAMAAHIFTPLTAFSFMIFNQLTVPCQACIGATRSEMKSGRWTAFAIIYQIVFSYAVALMIYQFGLLISTGSFTVFTVVAFIVFALMVYLLARKPYDTKHKLGEKALSHNN